MVHFWEKQKFYLEFVEPSHKKIIDLIGQEEIGFSGNDYFHYNAVEHGNLQQSSQPERRGEIGRGDKDAFFSPRNLFNI